MYRIEQCDVVTVADLMAVGACSDGVAKRLRPLGWPISMRVDTALRLTADDPEARKCVLRAVEGDGCDRYGGYAGSGHGYGYGDGNGYSNGYGYGYGDSYGYGYGDSDGDGLGRGDGYGDGDGYGYGYGHSYNNGNGYGDGYGDGNGGGLW